MAKNEVSIFDNNQVPDHIRKFNEEVETNIVGSNRADTLTYKGKVWTVSIAGDKQVLMKKNEDGDEEPRQTIPVVILDIAKRRGRSYYESGFDDGSPKAPTCWSNDGIRPDDNSEVKQNDKCSTCSQAAKGSKVSEDGRETKACQEHKFIAVQLHRKYDTPPLRLRLAITSIYDAKGKEQQAKGYYALDQYLDMLRARGVKHSAEIVTRLKFDPGTAYPKVLFNASAWTGEEDLEILKELAHSDVVKDLINPVFEPGGATESKADKSKPLPDADPEEDEPELTPAPKPKGPKGAAAAAPKPKPAARTAHPAPVEPEEEEVAKGEIVTEGGEDATTVDEIVEDAEESDEDAALREAEEKAKALRDKIAAKKKAETDKAAAAAKTRKAAAETEEGDDEGTVVMTPPKPPKATTAAAKTNGAAAPKAPVAGKTQTPKGTPAGKPAAVSKETQEVIDDWD